MLRLIKFKLLVGLFYSLIDAVESVLKMILANLLFLSGYQQQEQQFDKEGKGTISENIKTSGMHCSDVRS